MSYPIDPIATSLYVLNAFQRTFFSRSGSLAGVQVQIWGTDPIATNATAPNAAKGEAAGQYIPLYTNVPASLQPSPEYDMPSPMGRGEEVNLMTLDEIGLHALQPMRDAWYFVVLTPGLAWTNLWWMAEGNAMMTEHPLFRMAVYKCKRMPNPPPGWVAPGYIGSATLDTGVVVVSGAE